MGLYVRADRKRLLALVESLYIKVERYLRFQVGQLSYSNQGQVEHRQLLAACAELNAELAIKILERHIRAAAEKLVLFLEHNRKNAAEAVLLPRKIHLS